MSTPDIARVPKTYKLFVGGAFVRSESGRTYSVAGADGSHVAHVAAASRKDVRDAVEAARAASAKWAGATAYLRGQILYRVAEVLDGRRDQFVDELLATGAAADAAIAADEVSRAVAAWVWWAGWTDKLATVLGSVNPVAGPFLNVSHVEPVGVVALVAADSHPLLAASHLLGAALAGANTCVLLPSARHPLAPLSLAEVLATSDVPAGVVNIASGAHEPLVGWLAEHADVDALDITGVAQDQRAEVIARGASSIQRTSAIGWDASPHAAAAFLEIKTVWHPNRV